MMNFPGNTSALFSFGRSAAMSCFVDLLLQILLGHFSRFWCGSVANFFKVREVNFDARFGMRPIEFLPV
jgi:hypothetical protein